MRNIKGYEFSNMELLEKNIFHTTYKIKDIGNKDKMLKICNFKKDYIANLNFKENIRQNNFLIKYDKVFELTTNIEENNLPHIVITDYIEGQKLSRENY